MGSISTDDQHSHLRASLEIRDTDELIGIWRTYDIEEWTEDALNVIAEILTERLGELPAQQDDTLTSEDIYRQIEKQLQQASALLDDGELEQSLDICTSALQLNPDHAEAHFLRGRILLEMERIVDGIAALRNAIRLDWGHGEARDYMRLAQGFYREDLQETPAQEHLDQALEFVENDEIQAALQECRQVIDLYPEYSVGFNYTGMIYQQLQRYEEAVSSYQKAVELDPTFSNAYENLYHAERIWKLSQFEHSSEMKVEITDNFLEDQFSDDESDALPMQDPTGWERQPDAERALFLLGWPGHRTLPGRFGLDPIDTYNEEAHIEGVVLRKLLTGRFRTQDRLLLFVMVFFCFLFLSPLLGYVLTVLETRTLTSGMAILILYAPYWLIGLLFLWNTLKSVSSPGDFDEDTGNPFY